MFLIQSLADVEQQLSHVYGARIRAEAYSEDAATIRGPVGLFLVRADGGCGSKLAMEVVGSFGYWHLRSAQWFDGIFLGWGVDGETPAFVETAFVRCVRDLEQILDWLYRGGADLILTDFVFDARTRKGTLDFSRGVPLDITALLDEKKFAQLGKLMEALIAPVTRDRQQVAETSAWEISDYIAALRTREVFWKTLVKRMGDILGWADEVARYAVRDLRRR